ncbi:13910_t:CDS:2, partial [Racocetra fulgida]
RGGFGTVYRANSLSLGYVAIKEVDSERDEKAQKIFRNEHTLNILIHDGNIKISDFGLSKNLNSIATSSKGFYGVIPFIDPCKLQDQKYP